MMAGTEASRASPFQPQPAILDCPLDTGEPKGCPPRLKMLFRPLQARSRLRCQRRHGCTHVLNESVELDDLLKLGRLVCQELGAPLLLLDVKRIIVVRTTLSKSSLDFVSDDFVSSGVGNSLGDNFVCSFLKVAKACFRAAVARTQGCTALVEFRPPTSAALAASRFASRSGGGLREVALNGTYCEPAFGGSGGGWAPSVLSQCDAVGTGMPCRRHTFLRPAADIWRSTAAASKVLAQTSLCSSWRVMTGFGVISRPPLKRRRACSKFG